MSITSERNIAAKLYVDAKINVSKERVAEEFAKLAWEPKVSQMLTDLIEVKAKGFRGIVVTALTGMYLNDDYNPLDNFYKCNPRSIFEHGIFYALQENRIPCGKSDPLNVAKNVNRLNEDWAEGKRPAKAALAVVSFLRLVLAANSNEREELIDYFFFRLWQYARKLDEYEIIQIDTSLDSKIEIGIKLIEFTLAYPESGQLPQFLVSQLLQANFKYSDVTVVGGKESVFGTNTTSKKPADIWLERVGKITNLYEITVKTVSIKRLEDCIDALRQTGHLDCPVTFICRIQEDTSSLEIANNHVVYKNKRFEFIDYYSFCLSLFALLSKTEVDLVQANVSRLVEDVSTSMRAKQGWNALFSQSIDS